MVAAAGGGGRHLSLINRSCTRDSIRLNYNINRANEQQPADFTFLLFAPLERFKFLDSMKHRSHIVTPLLSKNFLPFLFRSCIRTREKARRKVLTSIFVDRLVSFRSVFTDSRTSFLLLSTSCNCTSSHFYFVPFIPRVGKSFY